MIEKELTTPELFAIAIIASAFTAIVVAAIYVWVITNNDDDDDDLKPAA